MPTSKNRNRGKEDKTDSSTTIVDSFLVGNQIQDQQNSKVQCRIKVLKLIGTGILLCVSTSIPGFMILNHEDSQQIGVFDYRIESRQNETACVYIKQYDIFANIYVTVCNTYGVVVVDIRQFYNESASIKGIQLSERQWVKLKQVSSLIDKSIQEARIYWKDLKVLKYNSEN